MRWPCGIVYFFLKFYHCWSTITRIHFRLDNNQNPFPAWESCNHYDFFTTTIYMLEKLALQKKFITNAQCSQAINACRSADNFDLALTNYFKKENILTDKQMNVLVATYTALKTIQKNQIFGNCAVDLGLVNEAQFLGEMARQKKILAENKQPEFIGKTWRQDQTLSQEQYETIIWQLQKTHNPQGSAHPAKPVTDPEPKQTDYSLNKVLDCGVMLEIDASGMGAFIRKTGTFKETVTAAKLIEQLKDNGITYGLVESPDVENFIASSGFRINSFRVAQGTDPLPGKDARVELFFETDHLKAGGIDENGRIDFKDRGPIPWIKKGGLLAKKFPLAKASKGKNVFGQVLDVPGVSDINLEYGKGVVCSSDGLELYAQISGTPILDRFNKVRVNPVFTVPNDVNFETGHIDYDGEIVIKGTLKAGFKAMGHVIRAGAVDGGAIRAAGDVTVLNGMIGGTVYARGHVSIKFVRSATIYCLGNLTVDKEILDSRIVTSGAVIIKNGKIIASDITSNKGLFAQHLGTEKSVPNTVTFGVDTFTDRELKEIQDRIEQTMKEHKRIHEKLNSLSKEIFRNTINTLGLVHNIDRAKQENDVLSKNQGDTTAPGLKSQIQVNNRLMVRLDRVLNQMIDRIEKKKSRRRKFKVELTQLESTLEKLRSEKSNFIRWQQRNPGMPQAVVTGQVMPGTMIHGPDVSREITKIRKNVKIFQTLEPKDGDTALEIEIVDTIK